MVKSRSVNLSSLGKKKCEKLAGAGKRPPPFPSLARLIFALRVLILPHYSTILSESLAQATPDLYTFGP